MARLLAALATVFVAMPVTGWAQPSAAIAIVVHQSNPVTSLTQAELRQILLLERQSWPTNKKITVVMRDSGQSERAALLRTICRMSEHDFDRHVLQVTFQGSALSPPRTISTADGMLRFVFNVPGALGYVRADEVNNSVKVVRVDGMLPGDQGYPLVLAGGGANSGAPSRPR
jgi:ABC-type phosphate transport system substrate-binding protein